MMHKLNRAALMAYAMLVTCRCRLRNELRELWTDERGISDIVAAVLLILVAVLGIAALWALLGQFIQDKWDEIVGKSAFK